MVKLAILLSGGGSNAEKICAYFKDNSQVQVKYLLSNKENSGAKRIGETYGIPFRIFNREEFNSGLIADFLLDEGIDVVILAGFLWLVPQNLLATFPDKVINIHPALLPKYGGKGMHGAYVHQAVYNNKETESGITIHLCNEEFDKGAILFQAKVLLNADDAPEIIAKKVLQLEHQYFPKVIENFCRSFEEKIG
ncbi:MAG TPA: phosphoribosylglycinamide formyltransferase [Chitinophagales bacterium]|nr:phosphoribosylglycinamide formyltransferase [Chitinophagales bacterium]MCB9075373.1 phosphoribosylglycinamide formyltransferase [Chitinophagales bacterium]HMU97431.1 phosphoribosylglycinamide formyltransferase [Chitinophagales bacterium]HMV01978.1 phosphoribosylglycinamide formyltransferase [Chitinophagales bacterium]HMW93377.1 phosphoribosylglycinamide formyltransferase [Chitinophagales bacterium]